MDSVFAVIGMLTVAFLGFKLFLLFKSIHTMITGCPLDFKRHGQWAVVTGCTDGIGKAFAEKLADNGMDVVLVSRSPSKLETTAKEIETDYKVKTKTIAVDFTGGPEIYEILKNQLSDLDIGILVNNVGMGTAYPQYFLEGENKEESIRNMMRCNMDSATFLTYHVLPSMLKKSKGIIVNVASGAALSPYPLFQVYAATKAYVDSFTQALAYEYKDSGVIIQSLITGLVTTKMSRNINKLGGGANPSEYVESALNTIGVYGRTTGFWKHELLWALISPIMTISQTLMIWLTFKSLESMREDAAAKSEKKDD